jgi:hypothetical protein
MLVKKDEAKKMYCPFKFSKPVNKESGQINPEWICEGPGCMAWQKSWDRDGLENMVIAG